MELDQNTLFFAAGVCSLAVALTILTVWYQNRWDRFLLWGCLGMIVLGVGSVFYYSSHLALAPSSMIAFSVMTCGFMLLLVGANTVSKNHIHSSLLLLATVLMTGVVITPIMIGYAGIGIAIFNIFAAIILIKIGTVFMSVYPEAPVPVFGMVTLYFLTALSFLLCAMVIVAERQWTLRTIPSNWAEDLNAIMAIIGITGIGALSLSFTQARISKRHANEARIDSLTGLLNRRAVFSLLATTPLKAGDAAIAFDLDRFKAINDTHGHAAGDRVLEEFATILRNLVGESGLTARLGGEEFLVVMRDITHFRALTIADAIRDRLSACTFIGNAGPFQTTTSAGIGFFTLADREFDVVFQRADAALYRAKGLGRNRVCTELQVVA
ncbi:MULTISPECIES: GGDEF domain-containing protein [Ochrobactrum]|uniref:diguanylate cyclase n=1 Tax=Ochrobactrum quorumnocens TaxID=271865 RepID=A0A5N1JT43_9HYPH|nr:MULTISPECIES: GGDEF domain-containing protein [Brucella/Ochrobactrum group]KAA9367076.1 GGDEF domain-containing protein [[Ochrobactrum] quorumnocens]MBD7992711.1 GGDEF domain-containing protein [Ochrobactrum gallinarum]MDH7793110.1 diguanylate cyclase (GGDEF)-like protein [Ochrobactrum sp. AN78]